ncbi:MAG TPA: SDR family oxidoreductase [Bryobacteraceae bacterium]|nr:SDR family oxidoreductase [Bryobacteraceae bacterium]
MLAANFADTELKGKVAVVTGTSGIGKAVALRFARSRAKVVACGIDDSLNSSLKEQALTDGLALETVTCDVAEPTGVQAAIAKTLALFGGLDILVNAAAVHPFGTVEETTWETWNRCLNVNVGGIFLFAHFGIAEMKKRGQGVILNLASVQGFACQNGVAAYATSKGAIHSFTRALALDCAPFKIRVNSISPGSIDTPMLEFAARTFSPEIPVAEVFKRFGGAHPLNRIGTPEEVAELALFLASDKAAFCTGADYRIDGGLTAGISVK